MIYSFFKNAVASLFFIFWIKKNFIGFKNLTIAILVVSLRDSIWSIIIAIAFRTYKYYNYIISLLGLIINAKYIFSLYKLCKFVLEKEKILVFESDEKELLYKQHRLRIICKQDHLG
jgi:hypothetical protein